MIKAVKDPWFYFLLLAAPLVWLGLWLVFERPVTLASTLSLTTLLLVIVVYPVLEEIVFRGGLQGWLMEFPALKRNLLGISLGNLLASLVFVAFHFIYHAPMWAALVFIPSLAFGFARDRYFSVLPGMVLHSFYNAGFVGLFG